MWGPMATHTTTHPAHLATCTWCHGSGQDRSGLHRCGPCGATGTVPARVHFVPTDAHSIVATVEGVGCTYLVHQDEAAACTVSVYGAGPAAASAHLTLLLDGATFAAAMVYVVNEIEADCCSSTRLEAVEVAG